MCGQQDQTDEEIGSRTFQLKLNASDWFKVGKSNLEKRDFSIFEYSKADWNHIEAQIEAQTFLPYC